MFHFNFQLLKNLNSPKFAHSNKKKLSREARTHRSWRREVPQETKNYALIMIFNKYFLSRSVCVFATPHDCYFGFSESFVCLSKCVCSIAQWWVLAVFYMQSFDSNVCYSQKLQLCKSISFGLWRIEKFICWFNQNHLSCSLEHLFLVSDSLCSRV